MATSIASSQAPPEPALRAAWRPALPPRIVALAPLWALIIVALASPSFYPAMTTEYPNIAGLSFGAVLEGLALIWMLLGVAVVWPARAPLIESLAFTVFTVPATVAVVLAPALVLVMQNLG